MKILCDTHSHTIASTHAYSTVHDYVRDAQNNGIQLVSITDHAPSMPDAPHYWHFVNMKVIPRVIDNIAILRGIETNILPEPYQYASDRNVDLTDQLKDKLDFAIASFHEPVFKPQDMKTNTKAMIDAMKSGCIQILGHPGNPAYPIDQEEVVRAAKDNNVAIEINNSSFKSSRVGSEPYCVQLMELVDKHNWKLSVSSDAHISLDVGKFEIAVAKLTQVGFDPEKIVNKTPQRFLSFLAEHGCTAREELSDWLAAL
ncbi:phosphatase [Reinekea marinisedimentorum]|uniref:Putative hydrolase n=1 Tax=Reinekea marinisedimentorum TaxID=230495 RepID=A0A4R3IAT9_9GAMM|nr:phosphatase [Reinekea marinisedimentorum]TCS43094.1 putative hydrolase [Reinekea marinisedimentorum]